MARRRRDGRRDNENLMFIAFSPSVIFLRKTTAIALLRYLDFVYAAWSAAQNRPLRQQILPLSATGGGRICCPSEGACVCAEFSLFTLLSSLFSARQYTHPITFDFGKRMQSVLPFGIFVSQNSVASLTVFLPYF